MLRTAPGLAALTAEERRAEHSAASHTDSIPLGPHQSLSVDANRNMVKVNVQLGGHTPLGAHRKSLIPCCMRVGLELWQ